MALQHSAFENIENSRKSSAEPRSVRMPFGPGVDDIEHSVHGLGRDEAEPFLQYRVNDRMQAVLDKVLVVIFGLPDLFAELSDGLRQPR
jgi:hypothetical protein